MSAGKPRQSNELKSCRECGGEVAGSGTKCPHCGAAYPAATEIEAAIARQKSYVGAAVLTFLLYWVFFFPGLIANCLYLDDARRTAKLAGRTPRGVLCLWVMFILGMLVFVSILAMVLA